VTFFVGAFFVGVKCVHYCVGDGWYGSAHWDVLWQIGWSSGVCIGRKVKFL